MTTDTSLHLPRYNAGKSEFIRTITERALRTQCA